MWHLARQLLDLIPKEFKLHSLVDVERWSASVVVPKVALHELDLKTSSKLLETRFLINTYRVGWVRDEHLG